MTYFQINFYQRRACRDPSCSMIAAMEQTEYLEADEAGKYKQT